jgi:hypothetical protein
MPELPDDDEKFAELEAPQVSRITLAELTEKYVAEHYPAEPSAPPLTTAIAPRPPAVRARPAGALRRYTPWLLGGGGCALLIAIVVLAVVLANAASPGGRETPGRSQAPTDTARPDREQTAQPTVVAGPPPTPLLEGDYHEAYYDDTAFYLRNLSENDRPIAPIAFERLHNNGNILDRFEGWRWSEIYPKHVAGLCVVIEIVNYVDHLDPEECENRAVITRTPTLEEGEDYIFWTQEGGSKVFRVLWFDVEVARCEIDEGYCEIYLP